MSLLLYRIRDYFIKTFSAYALDNNKNAVLKYTAFICLTLEA